jgi:formylglycine-generating enzyme required for sulfatase activity
MEGTMAQKKELLEKLQKIEQAIAAQQNLRGMLPNEQIETSLGALHQQKQVLLAKLEGSGAVAQGAGAKAAGERGVIAEKVGGHVFTGDHVTIHELPVPVLKMFANQFGFDPEASDAEALKSYFNNVIFERHSKLSFLFIEPKTGKVYTEADIEDVFVPLQLVNPKISARNDQKHGREVFRQLVEGDDALSPLTLPDVLADHDCVLLRGKPGSGKTTPLRHIALSFARQEHQTNLNWTGPVPLPLMIPLRNFGAFLQRKNRDGGYLGPQPRALLEYLQESLRWADVRFSSEFLPERLQEGQCLLLLDALDEVSGELGNGGDLRAAVARQVSAFIRHYRPKGNRFLLTSRPRAYQDESAMRRALPQPQVFDVLDLGRDSYHQLIKNLLTVLTGNPEAGHREANDLSKRVMRNQQLADLASNPLLCTTLVLVYKYYGRRLPERRVDVLDEVVTLLLGRWEEERQYVFSPDELVKAGTSERTAERAIEFRRRALVSLAWHMQETEQAELDGPDAEAVLTQYYCQEERASQIEAEKWAHRFLGIAHERSGLFIAVDENIHTFSHQAFREYFAATHLVNAGEERLQTEVMRHAPEPDDWWRQVILLAGAHPQLSNGAAGRLIEMLMNQKEMDYLALAARFAQDMTDKLPGQQRKRLQDWFLDVINDPRQNAKKRVQAGRSLALAGDPRPGVGLDDDGLPAIAWQDIPDGPFLMGSKDGDKEADNDEKPQHEQVIPYAYQISRYPVTNAQYSAFVQAGGYEQDRYWTESGWTWREKEDVLGPREFGQPFGLSNHPVVGVSWYEAVAFCRWLTEQLREKGELENEHVVSLPTEPQWEKAARGTDGCIYPWGDEPDPDGANYDDTGVGATSAVGCFPRGASPYGALDLSGNVWEWCLTKWENDYENYEQDNRLEETSQRVLRGGSFDLTPGFVRCAVRFVGNPYNRNLNYGFRVCVSPLPRRGHL